MLLAALGSVHLLTDPATEGPLYEAVIVWLLAGTVVHAGYDVRQRSLTRSSQVRALTATAAAVAAFAALAAIIDAIWVIEGSVGRDTQFMLLFAAALGGAVGSRLALYEAHLREELAENEALSKLLKTNERVLRHNLRNELSVALGHLDNLEDRLGSEEDLREVRRRLVGLLDTSDRARRTVAIWESDVSDTFDLRETAVAAVERLNEAHPDAARTTVTVPDGLTVRAHAAFPRALDELLDNAVVHTDGPVEVWVRATVPDQGHVCLTVVDDGAGIGDQEAAALFGAGETPLSHGGGVGLPLVYWIVRKSGGELRIEERDGGGAVVELWLPRARGSDRREEPR